MPREEVTIDFRYHSSTTNAGTTTFIYNTSSGFPYTDIIDVIEVWHAGVKADAVEVSTSLNSFYVTQCVAVFKRIFTREQILTSSSLTVVREGPSNYYVKGKLVEKKFPLKPINTYFIDDIPTFELKDYHYNEPEDFPPYEFIAAGTYLGEWGKKDPDSLYEPTPFADPRYVVFPALTDSWHSELSRYYPSVHDPNCIYTLSSSGTWGYDIGTYSDKFKFSHLNIMRESGAGIYRYLYIEKTDSGFKLYDGGNHILKEITTPSQILFIEIQAEGGRGGWNGYEKEGNSSCGGGGGGGSGAFVSFYTPLSEVLRLDSTVDGISIVSGNTECLIVGHGEWGVSAWQDDNKNYNGGNGGNGGVVIEKAQTSNISIINKISGNSGGNGGTGYNASGTKQGEGEPSQNSYEDCKYPFIKGDKEIGTWVEVNRGKGYGQTFNQAKQYDGLDNDNVFAGGGGGASSFVRPASSWSSTAPSCPIGCGGYGGSGFYSASMSFGQNGGPYSIWIHYATATEDNQ